LFRTCERLFSYKNKSKTKNNKTIAQKTKTTQDAQCKAIKIKDQRQTMQYWAK